MTPDEMETLPFPQYGAPGEMIYAPGQGFVPVDQDDYLLNFSLGYQTVWSIGCPFHCSFCGNTKFIANDPSYKKIRHPSARYIVDEVKSVRRAVPATSARSASTTTASWPSPTGSWRSSPSCGRRSWASPSPSTG